MAGITHSRQRAAETFGLDYDEMSERHHLTFDTYEEGKLSLEEYLNRVVFYEDRSFSREDFKKFMYAQSKPYPEMINLIRGLEETIWTASCCGQQRRSRADHISSTAIRAKIIC